MRNQKGSLVFLRKTGVFGTRDEALKFIDDNYKFASVYGEPFVVKYGDENNPNLILGIGSKGKVGNKPGGGGYTIIDITETNKNIDELNTKTNEINTDLASVKDKVYDELPSQISDLNNSIDSLGEEVAKKAENIELSGEGLEYTLYVDGNIKGKINIPKDRFLSEVEYDAATHELIFHFVTTESDDKVVKVNVESLVDVYKAGDGLKINKNNKISVDIDNNSEGYLQISSEKKLGVYGLNEKFEETKNSAKNYADTKVSESENALRDLISDVQSNVDNETQARVNAINELNERIGVNEDLVDIINGNEATEGSFRNAVADALTEGKGYADTKVSESENALRDLISDVQSNVDNETQARVNAINELDSKISANESAISIINGNEATEGSVKKAVADALTEGKGYTDEQIGTLSDKVNNNKVAIDTLNGNALQEGSVSNIATGIVTNAVNTLSESLNGRIDGISETVTANANEINDIKNEIENVIEGNEAQEGSVKNSIKVSKDYTDSKVSDLQTQINSKVNSSDVYTKTDIDNKGYITDVSNLATKESVIAVSESVGQNTNKIAAIEQTVNDNLFVVDETDTIKLTKEDGSPKKLAGEVKIKDDGDNIIHKDGNGIYANVTLAYNKAENKLTFNTGGVDYEFELSNYGIIQDAMYDAENKQIVLIVKKDDETTKRIEIPVSGLVNTWEVENTENSPIILKKEEKENGDVLSATVSILNNDKNLLVNNNGSLFANSDSNEHYAIWRGEDSTVQRALNNINDFLTLFDYRISNLEQKYNELQTKVEQTIIIVNEAKEIAEEAKSKADELERKINELDENILEPGTYQP